MLSPILPRHMLQAVRIFNVGDRRRTVASDRQDAQFFSAANLEARNKIAEAVLFELTAWLSEGRGDAGRKEDGDMGRVAIFDATNSNRLRRANVVAMLQAIRDNITRD